MIAEIPAGPVSSPSRWRLALQGYLALVVAVVLGVLASAPVMYSRVRSYAERTYLVGALPADDTQLENWGRSVPGVSSFTTERRGGDLWIRSEYHSLSQVPTVDQISAQLNQLGYGFRGMQGGATGMISGIRDLLVDPLALAVMLAGMQVALGFIGVNRMRAAERRGEPLPKWFPKPHARALALGVSGGLLLLGLGLVNEWVLRILLGHSPPSPWDSAVAMPGAAKMVFLFFGGVGAPIAEEIFFRGYLFGAFRRAGHVWFGMCASAILFGGVHFSDSYNVPGICLFGFVLAWLYHRTGSLLAPIVAHAVNNSLVIAWWTWS